MEGVKTDFFALIHTDDIDEIAHVYFFTAYEIQKEFALRTDENKDYYRWFAVNALPLKDTEGNVAKMYGSATDIHDRIESEEALRQSEEKYRSLYESKL